MTITLLVLFGVLAFLIYDRVLRWRLLPSEKLQANIDSGHWRYLKHSIVEFRRRGGDRRIGSLRALDLLQSESKVERMVGWMIMKELFPEVAQRVPGYDPTAAPEKCREEAQKMLIRIA
ncbi:hypothetical protein Verru16b_03048 [Lacunisphaera limnophila]|uniref:Uncharacterized protein n=1 Tax=Lacunisphaera limnophila TaxID=1838286 RepID=A0A1D8AYK4_9BACT|nr:hypothetical protein [Lacunisphaera limnophila]AOS45957.1 hypothetical protein Verru16b_03048 [Lacunisphaera limnophila]